MFESREAIKLQKTAESSETSSKQYTEKLLDELAKDRRAPTTMAANSNDGYPCYIYRTKSDCEWHPPCHWAGANCQ